jgi:hypothetical protein
MAGAACPPVGIRYAGGSRSQHILVLLRAGVAQLAERHLPKVDVAGSIPVSRSA